MIVAETVEEIQQLRAPYPVFQDVGFVPTMGCLHEGHLSLVRESLREHPFTIVSIFVNPTQFNNEQDFEKYPRDNARDLTLLEDLGVQAVFLPPKEELYPKGFETSVAPGWLEQKLCGLSRPGHFRGVLTVVLKLLNIILPQTLYLGQKDYQQFLLITRMLQDMNHPTSVRLMPIVREENGLAMSSRNERLSANEREEAATLFQSMEMAVNKIKSGENSAMKIIEELMVFLIEQTSFDIDYASIVDPQTLEDIQDVSMKRPFLLASAGWLGGVRLIDNILHHPE